MHLQALGRISFWDGSWVWELTVVLSLILYNNIPIFGYLSDMPTYGSSAVGSSANLVDSPNPSHHQATNTPQTNSF